MERFEREIGLLRCCHYALELPVCLAYKGETIFSIPEGGTKNAGEVGGNPALSELVYDSGSVVQYLRTEAGENYILLIPGEDLRITVGPFLADRPSQSFVTDMVRAGKIGLRSKSAMLEYYDSLPQISGQRFFYSGRLLEQLFRTERGTEKRGEEMEAAVFIQPEYYLQTRDYRLSQFRHSPYMAEQEICRAISIGDTQGARRILREINSRPRARLAGTALRSLKNSVICSCSFMTRAAISGGVSPDMAFTLSDTYIQRIENCADINELLNFEDEMVSGFTHEVNEVKNARFSSAVVQAMSYIDAHLCEPVTVQQVAEAVYLSPGYLSKLFSAETGESVHAFIIRRRIEEAAYFVQNTTDSFADIASFYQFSSQSHFVQSFKKIMGITPGAFRRRTEEQGK